MSEVARQTREVSCRGVYTSMLEMFEHELYWRTYGALATEK